jgi:hypothetical protein
VKGLGAGLILIAGLALAGCGGDNTTTFVEQAAATSSSSSSASGSASASPSSEPSGTTTSPTPLPSGLRIIIDSPDGGSPISSPVDVSGTASVDNGVVVAVVLDKSGNELGRSTAKASASRPDFGHFDVAVDFSGATSGSKGQIKVFGVSPRDGKTPTYYYFISITFA